MRIKFNVFLSVLSLLIGSLFFYSCSDDTPNIDVPETEQPGDSEDNGDNSDSDNEGNQSAVEVPSSEILEDNTVSITYTGNDVEVAAAANISGYLSMIKNGGYLTLIQSDVIGDETGEITYVLSGENPDGSLTLEGSYKSTILLDGLNLSSRNGAAIDIQNGKRIKMKLTDGTVNTLTDGADGTQKAALYCKGHLEFSGSGSLNVSGAGSTGKCKISDLFEELGLRI